jgi:hypothetical protein
VTTRKHLKVIFARSQPTRKPVLDSGVSEVLNRLGHDYADMGDYDHAGSISNAHLLRMRR